MNRNRPTTLTREFGAVSDYQRLRRKRLLAEAEGYLELVMAFADQWSPPASQRITLAERALDTLAEIPELANQRTQGLFLTGQAYRVMHRYRDALSPLELAAELEPENIRIWLALAWCQKRTGRLDLAIRSLENALAGDPGEAIIHYNLACYWSLAGNPPTAIRYLSQALEISPAYRDLIADETDFDPIRRLRDFQELAAVNV
jgi:tetratricopeptide (TPR) repeat protein